MDISPKQAEEIQEIEKQLGNTTTPHILTQKQEKDRSILINILAALGISATATAAIFVLLLIPVNKKVVTPQTTVTTNTIPVGNSSSVVLQTEYVNPFSTTAQYDNPFIASQNPFANLSQ